MTPNTENADALQRVVLAGTRLMYDPKIFPTFEQGMQGDGPLPQKLAVQAVGLLKILMDKSNGTMPKNVLIPAAVALMLEMGDFLVKAKVARPTEDDMKQAVQLVIQMVMKVFGGPAPGAQPPTGPAPAPAQPAPGMIGA